MAKHPNAAIPITVISPRVSNALKSMRMVLTTFLAFACINELSTKKVDIETVSEVDITASNVTEIIAPKKIEMARFNPIN